MNAHVRRPYPLARVLRVLLAVLVLVLVTLGVAGRTASAEPAVHGYVDCPAPWRGQGCGFQTRVPQGSWIFLFRYRDNNGVVRSEVDSGTCTQPSCPAVTFAVPRIDRIPLGYDTYTSAPIAPPRPFVRF